MPVMISTVSHVSGCPPSDVWETDSDCPSRDVEVRAKPVVRSARSAIRAPAIGKRRRTPLKPAQTSVRAGVGSPGPGELRVYPVGRGNPMFQDRFDDPLVLNHADNPHLPLACWAGQGVHFVDLLNQLGPILSIGL